jgi:excisionase family DNA binding protein
MLTDTTNQRLLSLEEGAAQLGISKHTLRSYARRQLVVTVRFGRRRLISRETIAELAKHGVSPAVAKRSRSTGAPEGA